MSITLMHDEVVSKIFNNNLLLVNSDENEKILFGKGIGFGRRPGYKIPKGFKVDKIFVISDKENRNNFNSVIDRVDSEFFAACEEGIYEISKKIDQELNEAIHIGLIDHLYFAVKRLKNNEVIENPFLVEIETLYNKAFILAGMIADKLSKEFNINIPEDEIGFIALHIHSAMNNGTVSNTLKNSYLGNTIVEHVEDKLGVYIDRKSLDYARFLTHIKFALQRIMENRPINNQLTNMIKEAYPTSFEISKEIAKIIEDEIGTSVAEDEVTYLTIHIERFKTSMKY